MISRRAFVQGAGGVAGLGVLAGCGAGPFKAPGQAPGRVYRIAYLAPSMATIQPIIRALEGLGYVAPQNLSIDQQLIDQRAAAEAEQLLPNVATDLVRREPDVIVAQTIPATRAVMAATDSIPIVMRVFGDPVGNGLVASLARPGGNVTGVTDDIAEQLLGKRVELLRDTVGGLPRIATIVPVGTLAGDATARLTERAAQAANIELRQLVVSGTEDVASALETAREDRTEALIILPVPGLGAMEEQAVHLPLPTMGVTRRFVEAGGLMSYGPVEARTVQRIAEFVDKILRGARPTDLPVEQPREFEFVINLRTAHTLGLTIPQHVLLQATEVIQ